MVLVNSPVYVMWLRQLKRHFRFKARVIGSVAQPTLFLLALGFGLGSVFQKAGEGNYIQFLAPGVIAMSILFTAMFNGIEVIWDRQFGFLKETLVAPVSRFKIVVGRTLGGATVASFQGILVFLIALAVGFRPVNCAMVPVALLFVFLIAILFTSLGTAIASLLEDMQGFQVIMNFIIMPLFFLSGALFPSEDVPKFLSIIVKFNPLSYGINGLRGTLSGMPTNLFLNFTVLAICSIIVASIGSYLFSKIEL